MKTVVTHSGKFHPDDVFAVASVMMVEGKDNVNVIRSRNTTDWDNADWVVDVGGEYDPERLRFDHHQNGAPVRDNGIDYAGFGLVWKHYGEKICNSKEVADKIEERLVMPIDAGDVGVSLYSVNEYGISPAELGHVVASFLPPWQSELDMDEQFLKAVDFAYDYLERIILRAQAKESMKAHAEKLYDESEDKAVIVADMHVSAGEYIERDDVFAVVSPDNVREGYWVVSMIPVEKNSFAFKKTFPEAWGGLRGEELAEVSGIAGAEFCHKNRFIFVADSKEGALKSTEFLS